MVDRVAVVVLALSNYVFTTFGHAAMPIVIIYNSEPRLGVVRLPVPPRTGTQDDMGGWMGAVIVVHLYESRKAFIQKGTRTYGSTTDAMRE